MFSATMRLDQTVVDKARRERFVTSILEVRFRMKIDGYGQVCCLRTLKLQLVQTIRGLQGLSYPPLVV